MNVKFIFFLALMFISFFGKSQTYHPVLSMDKEWQVYSITHNANPPEESYTTYGLDNIVSFNTHQYYTFSPLYSLLNVVVREDTLSKQVFMYDVVGSTEYVSFDYSLNLGDTLPNNFAILLRGGDIYVDSVAVISDIDSVYMLDGTPRKRFYVTPSISNVVSGPYIMIEGLGGPLGFITPITTEFETGYTLQCVSDNGSPIYGQCVPMSVVKEEQVSTEAYPNPFKNQLNISSSLPIFMYVYNALGKEIHHSSTLALTHSLNTENYPQGMYLIKGVNENGVEVFSEKIVKE